GVAAFGSYEEALADPAVRVALILTPPASHLELAALALEAGKEVIVEKPPFLRSSDFDTIQELCARTGRRLFVAENYFYKPLASTLRLLLADDVIGEPHFFEVNALKLQRTGDWRDDVELAGGGALFEGGIHWINLLASLGPRVTRARGVRVGQGPGPERGMHVQLEFEGGAAGTLLYSWEVPSPLKGLRLSRIYGREGSISFESNGLWIGVWGRRKRFLLPGLRDIAGYRSMFADFFRAIRTGAEARMTLARARRDLELVEEAYRSAGVGWAEETTR
ncbi:MAG: Gfo/Idh/MocA family protein, partial [Gemmatimonadota bacterium]